MHATEPHMGAQGFALQDVWAASYAGGMIGPLLPWQHRAVYAGWLCSLVLDSREDLVDQVPAAAVVAHLGSAGPAGG